MSEQQSSSCGSATPYVSSILAVLAWIFYIVQISTPIIYWRGPNNYGYWGPWNSGNCSNAHAARDAIFGLLVCCCLFTVLAAIYGVLRQFVAALKTGCLKLVFIGTLCMTALFGFIATIVAFSLWGSTYCGYNPSDYDNAVGPSPIIGIFAFLFNVAAIVTEWKFSPDVQEEVHHQTDNIKHSGDHHNNNNAPTVTTGQN